MLHNVRVAIPRKDHSMYWMNFSTVQLTIQVHYKFLSQILNFHFNIKCQLTFQGIVYNLLNEMSTYHE